MNRETRTFILGWVLVIGALYPIDTFKHEWPSFIQWAMLIFSTFIVFIGAEKISKTTD